MLTTGVPKGFANLTEKGLGLGLGLVWVGGIFWFCFSLGAHHLRLHPPLINFGSASRGYEEANFDCFTVILFPVSNRRNRVTKLHFVISGVSNRVADWEERTGGILPT